MVRDAERTRANLLDAAFAEFAEHGIAGARVDRVAERAGCNKSLIYTHFGSKDGLFKAVFEGLVDAMVEGTPLDADDLPGYAASLSDRYRQQPEVVRLTLWNALEGDASLVPERVEEANRAKVAAIRAAQRRGVVSDELPASDLLRVVLTLSSLAAVDPEYPGPITDAQYRRRRASIVAAVRAVTAP